MSAPYRDSLLAIRRRVEAHELELQQLFGGFSSELWRLLPQARNEQIQRLRAQAEQPATDDPAQLQRCLAAREAALDEVQRLRRQLPRIEAEALMPALEVPDAARDLERVTPSLFPERWTSLRRAVQDLDPQASFAVAAKRGFLALEGSLATFQIVFSAFDAPFRLLGSTDGMDEVRLELRTSVAPATPPLRLEPEQLRHSLLLKPLGIVKEVELGDFTFDGLFLVEADEQAARRLLTLPVRQALSRLARYDVPQLEVGEGLAALRWAFETDGQLLQTALRALAEIRRVPLELKLWRGA